MILAVFRDRTILVRNLALAVGIGALAVLPAGCSGKPDIDITAYAVQSDPPDVLYNQGLANLKAGHFSEAARKFEAVDKEHPYSEYARKAILMHSWVKYRQGDYQEAINGGQRYLNLYPTSDDAPYAQYIVGLSYFRQIPDVTRDQTASRETIKAMSELVNRYPKSQYVPDAQEKIRFARDQLAGKDMQVGRYYQERHDYLAAVNRYRDVVENYANTRQVEEALERLVECYYALGLNSEAQTAAAVLGHNFPDSKWYKSAYALLKSKGMEPREDKGSWLSKAGALIMGGGEKS
ncbi:MAG TPA: outer membrane protein assembly factor BamD [Pararhizobium sp.]|nr:outer membrane protein assembly factor BamD [Pararhizobium sp.]